MQRSALLHLLQVPLPHNAQLLCESADALRHRAAERSRRHSLGVGGGGGRRPAGRPGGGERLGGRGEACAGLGELLWGNQRDKITGVSLLGWGDPPILM